MRLVLASTLLLGLGLLSSCAGALRYLGRRGMDAADCVKLNVGTGFGLTADVRVTDWFSPGLGVRSYALCVGYEDREIHGLWEEYLVINTPRAVWELSYGGPDASEEPELDDESRVLQLFLSSMLLANERWIRPPSGSPVLVEYASLLNIGQVGEQMRASGPANWMLEEGERPFTRHKSAWRKGFVEFGLMLLVVEARAGINPLEFLDFVAGVVGLDPAGDDR
jgi:hypothetical protein